MNICKVRRLRTFLHCKCTLAMQQRPSRLPKDLMLICSHVALLHFVLVSSIFCQKYKFLGETCQFRPLCPEGMQLVVSSHGGRLSCAPLTSPVLLTVTGTVEHLSQMSTHQCPKSDMEGNSSTSCFWRRGKIELFLVGILTGWACGSRC